MNGEKDELAPIFSSNFSEVDEAGNSPEAYEELPELTDEMIARGRTVRGMMSDNPEELVRLWIPEVVVDRWREGGDDWQERMIAKLSEPM